MTAKIVEFPGQTTLDIPPEKVLAHAAEHDLEAVVVIGRDEEGFFYMSSSDAYKPDILWLIEQARQEVLSHD